MVSILVLLDDAYRLFYFEGGDENAWRFQSLFFWMMPTGRELDLFNVGYDAGFQSLFFWMMPTGRFLAYIRLMSF